ncbi:HAMP domain-containing protein [bacterium]|jgi:sigma-B regulation protein RsbU (phosphoserine phosphatase)|nr:HAMP domain-containing protein [bacterium]
MKYNSIAFKLIAYILISCSALFLGIFGYNYLFSKRMITENISENAKNLTRATVNEVDSILYRIQKVPQGVASLLEYNTFDKNELLNILYSAVESNAEIYGATISFEAYAFEPESLYFAPYYCKKKDKPELTYLGGESYQYFYLDWYQIPKEIKTPAWSEPYYDEGGGNILMATYSVPFYRNVGGERKFAGVVTADISLMWLQEMVSSIKIAKSGYGFLISRNGIFVTHPNNKLIMNETIFSLAEETGNAQLREIGRSMVKGEDDFVSFFSMVNEKKSWLSYAPLSSSGWSLGVIFPREELLSDINRLNRVVLALSFFGLAVLFIILFFIAMSITRPIKILAATTRDIGKGSLDFELSGITSKDEVGMLADSFIYMRDSLKKYIRDLTETTAVKERMQSELRIAHDIQMGIVPKIFPRFPAGPSLIYTAYLNPQERSEGIFTISFLWMMRGSVLWREMFPARAFRRRFLWRLQ